jgi:hypothetical protein
MQLMQLPLSQTSLIPQLVPLGTGPASAQVSVPVSQEVIPFVQAFGAVQVSPASQMEPEVEEPPVVDVVPPALVEEDELEPEEVELEDVETDVEPPVLVELPVAVDEADVEVLAESEDDVGPEVEDELAPTPEDVLLDIEDEVDELLLACELPLEAAELVAPAVDELILDAAPLLLVEIDPHWHGPYPIPSEVQTWPP